MVWILLVLLYGLLKGSREISKKKAMDKNSVMEVLFTYTLISFILVIPQVKNAGGMELRFYFYIALKSFFIFIAWICGFKSLKRLPVSVYGILDLSRVLFATFLGVIVLGEKLNYWQIAGLIIVCAGLLLLRFKPMEPTEKVPITAFLSIFSVTLFKNYRKRTLKILRSEVFEWPQADAVAKTF